MLPTLSSVGVNDFLIRNLFFVGLWLLANTSSSRREKTTTQKNNCGRDCGRGSRKEIYSNAFLKFYNFIAPFCDNVNFARVFLKSWWCRKTDPERQSGYTVTTGGMWGLLRGVWGWWLGSKNVIYERREHLICNSKRLGIFVGVFGQRVFRRGPFAELISEILGPVKRIVI